MLANLAELSPTSLLCPIYFFACCAERTAHDGHLDDDPPAVLEILRRHVRQDIVEPPDGTFH